MTELLFVGFLATVFTTDAVVLGQFGFSRPIVCGPLLGYLLGDITLGLNIGVILELIWINTIPIGTTLVPDVTAATALAVYWSRHLLSGMDSSRVAIVMALIFALPISFVFRKSDLILRRLNSYWNKKIEAAVDNDDFCVLDRVVYFSFLIFVVKNFILFLITLPLYKFLLPLLYIVSNSVVSDGLENAFKLLAAVGIGVFLYNFYDSVFKMVKK